MLSYMKEKPEKFYDIIVGCDSSSGEEPHFPVAAVILRVGEGVVIPPNIEHEAIPLEPNTKVMDVFYPIREEYL